MATKPSTEVDKVAYALPPALANTPALDIDSGDIILPRVKIAHTSSVAFQNGAVRFGDLYSAAGKEDPDPEVLRDVDSTDEGVLFHVIGIKKGKSATVDKQFTTYDFNDPNAPVDALVTYDYTVCLPEVDAGLPYKWLMSSSASGPAAKSINMLLKRNEENGPPFLLAFRATTKPRENPKGKFYSLLVRQVEATPENIKATEALAILIASAPQIVEREFEPSTQPAI